jgi:toxin CcdB
MPQFDVHRSHDGTDLLLDCQSDLLGHFDTRFVIPLLPTQTAQKLSRLHPVFEVEGQNHILATQLASAVDARELGARVASLADRRYDILNAVDMLVTGV